MTQTIVIVAAVIFSISIFPLHIFIYVYANSETKYASINVTAYRLITLMNANTVKGAPDKVQMNGKEKKVGTSLIKKNLLKIFNALCFTKIIQLASFGLKNELAPYAALAQKTFAEVLYTFVLANGFKTKLRNYTVFNYDTDACHFYLKLVGVINLITLGRIFLMLLWEKLNERKTKKQESKRV